MTSILPTFPAVAVGFQPWVLVPVAIAVLVTAIGYRRTTPALSPSRRALLVTLRSGTFLLLAWILLEPTLTRESTVREVPTVLALLDRSASMGHADAGEAPRFERAQTALGTLAEEAARRGARTTLITFSNGLDEAYEWTGASVWKDVDPPDGPGTDLLASYREVLERYGQENLSSIFLFSDGRVTTGSRDYLSIGARGIPLFAVGVGDTAGEEDLAITGLDYSPVAFLDSKGEIRVRLEARGQAGSETVVKLLRGDRVVQRRRIDLADASGSREVSFAIEFDEVGRLHYTIEVEPSAGERNRQNNQADAVIRVLKAKMRVAFLDPHPGWDFSFLKRSLEADPNLECHFVYGHPTRGAVDASTGKPWSFSPGPTEAPYDLVVIRSCEESFFPERFRADLVRLVEEEGASVLFLGGERSVFDQAVWFARFEDLLPVTRGGASGQRYTYSEVRCTPQGEVHPVTASLHRRWSDAEFWSKLPPLLGYPAGITPRGGTEVLLTIAGKGLPPSPLLAVQPLGKGKTAVFTGIAPWRWSLLAGEEEGVSFFDQLWSNLVRWLCRPDDLSRFSLRTPRNVYPSGTAIPLLARVFDRDFRPVSGVTPRVTIRPLGSGEAGEPSSLVLIRDPDRPSEYRGLARGLPPGEYVARGDVDNEGESLSSEDLRFTVSSFSPEFANLRQDRDLLEGLALHSGGRYLGPEEIGPALASLEWTERETRIERRVDLWNHPALFLLVVGLLAGEWILRKRFGLL